MNTPRQRNKWSRFFRLEIGDYFYVRKGLYQKTGLFKAEKFAGKQSFLINPFLRVRTNRPVRKTVYEVLPTQPSVQKIPAFLYEQRQSTSLTGCAGIYNKGEQNSSCAATEATPLRDPMTQDHAPDQVPTHERER